jgi:hypothetical protein
MTDDMLDPTVPALSLLKGRDGRWAVSVNDYGPAADNASTIMIFDTEAEATAFIVEEKKVRGLTHH